jgi:hypothetical protein
MISGNTSRTTTRPMAVCVALLTLAAAVGGCSGNPFAKESDFVRRMRQHDEQREPGRADYEAELQAARRQQDDHAAHASSR